MKSTRTWTSRYYIIEIKVQNWHQVGPQFPIFSKQQHTTQQISNCHQHNSLSNLTHIIGSENLKHVQNQLENSVGVNYSVKQSMKFLLIIPKKN
jgi:hypothetical protein